jgi:hypothetical protein
MRKILKSGSLGLAACGAAIALMSSTGTALADSALSGDVGISYNSHFVSYGADVWGAGSDTFGKQSATFVYGDIGIAVTDDFALSFGAWSDVNNNVPSPLGGQIQEIDVYGGASYKVGKVTLGATYQAWSYNSDVEEVVDLSAGYDDTGLFNGFSLAPKVTWHYRTSGNNGSAVGSALVVGVSPSFPLTDSITLTIPASVGFFLTDDFQGGTKSGYGYSSIGASFGMPLSFIPKTYGAWSANLDLIGYFTNKDAIPSNPTENFLTESIGLKVAF